STKEDQAQAHHPVDARTGVLDTRVTESATGVARTPTRARNELPRPRARSRASLGPLQRKSMQPAPHATSVRRDATVATMALVTTAPPTAAQNGHFFQMGRGSLSRILES